MRTGILGVLAVVIGSAAAQAQAAPDIEGNYAGEGEGSLYVRTLILDPETGTLAASASVGSARCAGGFVGIGDLKGNVLVLRPWRKEEGAESCLVTLTFDKTGKTATIGEADCQYYHGAACAFEGKLAKKR